MKTFGYFLKSIYLKVILPLSVAIVAVTAIAMYFTGKLTFSNFMNALFIEAGIVLIVSAIFFSIGSGSSYQYYQTYRGTQPFGFEEINKAKDESGREKLGLILLSLSATLFLYLGLIYIICKI